MKSKTYNKEINSDFNRKGEIMPVDMNKVIEDFKKLNNSKEFQNLLSRVDVLKARWSDEKDYEDFNDYIKEIKKVIPKKLKFIKMSKSFTIKMKFTETTAVEIYCKPTTINNRLIPLS